MFFPCLGCSGARQPGRRCAHQAAGLLAARQVGADHGHLVDVLLNGVDRTNTARTSTAKISLSFMGSSWE